MSLPNSRLAFCLVGLLLSACSGGNGNEGADSNNQFRTPNKLEVTVGSVTIEAPATFIALGSSMQLTATVRDSSGAVLTGEPVSWSSSSSRALSVTSEGLVTANQLGSSTVTATADGVSSSIDLSAGNIRSMQIAAPTYALTPGGSVQLRLLAKSDGNADLWTSVTWGSSQAAVASVSTSGLVDALSVGQTTITATAAGRPVPAQLTLSVQAPVQDKIAFISVRGPLVGSPPQPNGGIYLMNPDGTDQQLLIASQLDRCSANPSDPSQCPKPWTKPTWNPDGLRLATASDRTYRMEFMGSMLFLCTAGGQPSSCRTIEPFPLPPGPVWFGDPPVQGMTPAWSPDGARLAYEPGIWDPATYTFSTNGGREPTWSPDGTHLAVVRDTGGNLDIWVKDLTGNTADVRLTDAPGDDTTPQWSPDGASIAFVSSREGNREIYVMASNGDAERNLTNNAADDASPTWSPDSANIAFDTNRDGNREIYVTGLDGINATNLTNNSAEDSQPAWSR